MKKPCVTDLTHNGQCSRCGQCCGSLLPVTDAEMQTLREHIRRNGITPSVPNKDTFVTLQCPLLQPATAVSPHAVCKAYNARPAICRVFRCDQTEQQTAGMLHHTLHGDIPDDLQNLWSLFDLTGIRDNSVDIKWSEAPTVIITTDEQEKYRIQAGQPLDLGLTDGSILRGFVINIHPDGLDMIDRNAHTSVSILFDKIGGILSPGARYVEPDCSEADKNQN